MFKTFVVFILFLFPGLLFAEVWTYSQPGELVETSPYYKVRVNQDEKVFDSFTYFWQATAGDLKRSSSWTTFSFTQKIQVEVEVLGENINKCVIRPKSKNIQFEIRGNVVYFELDKPQKLVIEINGNSTNPLFIFADASEENIPNKNEKGLWYFEPGMHKIGAVNLPDSVKHIYIAGGAIVEAAFRNKSRVSNLKITGRGILSSPNIDETEKNSPIIKLSGDGINSYVEGITILNGIAGGIEMQQSYSTLRNCKILEWNSSNVGVLCGPHALIENCFFRSSSDVIKMNRNYLMVQKCIFWQNESGAPFQLSWNLQNDLHNFRVVDCDVIYCEHKTKTLNSAIFSAVHGGSGNLSNYLFEDIRIEGNVYRLFKLTIRTSTFDTDPGYGSISNIQFKNISLEGKCLMASEIWGYNQNHTISNVIFENLKIAGRKIESANEGNFKINLNTTHEVVFK